jgi:hypothetical protein
MLREFLLLILAQRRFFAGVMKFDPLTGFPDSLVLIFIIKKILANCLDAKVEGFGNQFDRPAGAEEIDGLHLIGLPFDFERLVKPFQ